MAFLGNSMATGIAVGLASAYAAKEVLPALGQAVKPLARSGLKMGFMGYERMKEAFAHLGESIEDLAAETRSEIERAAQGARGNEEAGATAGEEEEGGQETTRRATRSRKGKKGREAA